MATMTPTNLTKAQLALINQIRTQATAINDSVILALVGQLLGLTVTTHQ